MLYVSQLPVNYMSTDHVLSEVSRRDNYAMRHEFDSFDLTAEPMTGRVPKLICDLTESNSRAPPRRATLTEVDCA